MQAFNFIKKRLWLRCFPVNLMKFLRRPFCIEHLWWLLLCHRIPFLFAIYYTFSKVYFVSTLSSFAEKFGVLRFLLTSKNIWSTATPNNFSCWRLSILRKKFDFLFLRNKWQIFGFHLMFRRKLEQSVHFFCSFWFLLFLRFY